MDNTSLNKHMQCDQNQLILYTTEMTLNSVLLYSAYICMAHNGQVYVTGNKYFIHLIQKWYFIISTFIYQLFQFSFEIQTEISIL